MQSFNTQPPEGGCKRAFMQIPNASPFQHTAARRRLYLIPSRLPRRKGFQHTAARRRLLFCLGFNMVALRFNTQPPEGG